MGFLIENELIKLPLLLSIYFVIVVMGSRWLNCYWEIKFQKDPAIRKSTKWKLAITTLILVGAICTFISLAIL
jgi:hypothetical protein